MSANDDQRGVSISMGLVPGRPSLLHLLAATPLVISTVNSVLAGVIVALVLLAVDLLAIIAVVLGTFAFVVALVFQGRYGRSEMSRLQASIQPVFPTPVKGPPSSQTPTI